MVASGTVGASTEVDRGSVARDRHRRSVGIAAKWDETPCSLAILWERAVGISAAAESRILWTTVSLDVFDWSEHPSKLSEAIGFHPRYAFENAMVCSDSFSNIATIDDSFCVDDPIGDWESGHWVVAQKPLVGGRLARLWGVRV